MSYFWAVFVGLEIEILHLGYFFPIRGDESQTMVNRILNQRKSCFSSKILLFHEINIIFSVKFTLNVIIFV